jgi:hypothetical protein
MTFLTALCGLLATTTLFAQTDMVWDLHGVGFKVPDDFKIETNNSEEFSAGNDYLHLLIAPIQDAEITKDDLAEAVLVMATEMGYDSVDEGDRLDIDDFTGYYVKGTKDGMNAVVMALLDRESSTNLLVVIVYHDDYEDEAVEIAGSFYAYD